MLIILVVKCDIRLLFFEFGVKQMRAMSSRIAIFFYRILLSLVISVIWRREEVDSR